MKLNKILSATIIVTLIVGVISTANAQNISIIPEPYQMTTKSGTYTLPKSIAINAPSSANAVSDLMAGKLRTTTGRQVYFTKNKPSIDLQIINDANLGTEGYTLDINEKGVQLKANGNAGLFFGWQTILQLLPASVYSNTLQANTNWTLPYVSIIDKPRFGWRGMMLDVSRHFFSKEDVKTFIDDMARYKYNRFHWHLTDDQGWRIEIKSLPKLTSVGAWRAERKGKWMNISTPAIDEPKTYGGFYTQEDIKEVVAYAKARFIEVIPEVDIPGHSMAINTAYPFLSTTPNYPFQVNAGDEFMDWEGVNGHVAAKIDNSLDPSNETVYEYLDKIFGEIAPLFPFEYIHTGGDENPKNNWEKSPNIQALMKKEGLKDMNEVQSYFVRRVQKIINSKGKKMMGWDEILEGGLSGDAAVMSWRGVKGGIEAAKQGHKVVMSPNDYNYIDFYQGEMTAEGKVYRGLRMKKTYSFEPVPEGIDPSLILGNQANQWSEQIFDMRYAQYMTWPRGMAVAETAWSPKEKKSWNSFSKKVENHFEKLDAAGVRYARSIYDPIVTTQLNSKWELIGIMEGEVEGLDIYYTMNDQMPDNYSEKYTGPFLIPEDVISLRVISYRDGKQIGKYLNIPIESLRKRAVKVL
ncbi:MAG: beta-N-acetylhexosaminidase [Chitinophagia bacterium]|nr:beta-N-acetylhexosaminidase [Chitinophagia bacterium]NCA29848.1 beta-N-acetylhexosaminidase [Chitinophagia bacterium]